MEDGSASESTPRTRQFAEWRSLDGERLLRVFTDLVEPLSRSLPIGTEVVLHDLSLIPPAIVAIHGTLSGRKIGDYSNEMVLERITDISEDNVISFESVMADGRKVRSTTVTIRDMAGVSVAALGINVDMTPWETLHGIASSFLGEEKRDTEVSSSQLNETGVEGHVAVNMEGSTLFVRDFEELASLMVKREIDQIGVPAGSMRKEQKLEIVSNLRRRGMFLLRESVPQVAEALGVTRFTIYKYLGELEPPDNHVERDEPYGNR